jgi:hypothetical protein
MQHRSIGLRHGLLGLALLAGGCGVGVWWTSSGANGKGAPARYPDPVGRVTSGSSSGGGLVGAVAGQSVYGESTTLYRSAALRRQVSLRASDPHDPVRNLVVVQTQELDPGTGEWVESEQPFGVSYHAYGVTGRAANSFYVVGTVGGTMDMDIVERWDIPHVTGAYYAERPRATSGVGVPVATPAVQEGVEGGAFLPPEQRGPFRPVRTALYVGPDLGGVWSLASDPDGRFVVLIAGDPGTIHQLIDERGGALAQFVPQGSIAASRAFALGPYQHPNDGRVWNYISFDPSIDHGAFLVDADNDGVIDGQFTLPYPDAQVYAAGLASDFVEQ